MYEFCKVTHLGASKSTITQKWQKAEEIFINNEQSMGRTDCYLHLVNNWPPK